MMEVLVVSPPRCLRPCEVVDDEEELINNNDEDHDDFAASITFPPLPPPSSLPQWIDHVMTILRSAVVPFDAETEAAFVAFAFPTNKIVQCVILIGSGFIFATQPLLLGMALPSDFILMPFFGCFNIFLGMMILLVSQWKKWFWLESTHSERLWILVQACWCIPVRYSMERTFALTCATLYPEVVTNPAGFILNNTYELPTMITCHRLMMPPYDWAAILMAILGVVRFPTLAAFILFDIVTLFACRWSAYAQWGIHSNPIIVFTSDGLLLFNYLVYIVLVAGRERSQRRGFLLRCALLEKIRVSEVARHAVNRIMETIIPPTALAKLVRHEETAEVVEDVNVLFSDIAGFTAWSSTRSAMRIVRMLNYMYRRVDGELEVFGVEKISTIGDAYWAACGLPRPSTSLGETPGAVRLTTFGLQMQRHVEAMRRNVARYTDIRIRVGIATGRATGGIIGSRQLAYQIFGEVNETAKHLEQQAPVDSVLICSRTKRIIEQLSLYDAAFLESEAIDAYVVERLHWQPAKHITVSNMTSDLHRVTSSDDLSLSKRTTTTTDDTASSVSKRLMIDMLPLSKRTSDILSMSKHNNNNDLLSMSKRTTDNLSLSKHTTVSPTLPPVAPATIGGMPSTTNDRCHIIISPISTLQTPLRTAFRSPSISGAGWLVTPTHLPGVPATWEEPSFNATGVSTEAVEQLHHSPQPVLCSFPLSIQNDDNNSDDDDDDRAAAAAAAVSQEPSHRLVPARQEGEMDLTTVAPTSAATPTVLQDGRITATNDFEGGSGERGDVGGGIGMQSDANNDVDLQQLRHQLGVTAYTGVRKHLTMTFADPTVESAYLSFLARLFEAHENVGVVGCLNAAWCALSLLIYGLESIAPNPAHSPAVFIILSSLCVFSLLLGILSPRIPGAITRFMIGFVILSQAIMVALFVHPTGPFTPAGRKDIAVNPSLLGGDLVYLGMLYVNLISCIGTSRTFHSWYTTVGIYLLSFPLPVSLWWMLYLHRWTIAAVMNTSGAAIILLSFSGYRIERERRSRFLDHQVAKQADLKILSERQELTALLERTMPKMILPELVTLLSSTDKHRKVICHRHSMVSVMFFRVPRIGEQLAIDSIDPAAAFVAARELAELYDSGVEHWVGQSDIIKVKTIGDTGMFVGGLQRRNHEHANVLEGPSTRLTGDSVQDLQQMTYLAMRLQAAVREKSSSEVVAGIHCGPAVSGVLGDTRLVYDVFGDTVNTASRVMSTALRDGCHGVWLSSIAADTVDAASGSMISDLTFQASMTMMPTSALTVTLSAPHRRSMKGKGEMMCYPVLQVQVGGFPSAAISPT